MKLIYLIRLIFNLWWRERQTYDPYIDVIDAKIWYLKSKIGEGKP